MSKEKQIIEIKECIDAVYGADCAYFDVDGFAIANEIYNAGYRKQEWISVDERLPEESGDYLTYHNGVISALEYSTKHKLFNAVDSLPEKFSKKHSIMVSHWMPLPEAPKGGE